MNDPKIKAYIGDSVYIEFDGYAYILTTENGYGPSNRIILEPTILQSLISWVEHLKERLAQENP